MITVVDLYLKHFSRVVTGLQVPEVYIDFRCLSHEFYLFVGKNGTGKTSILHTIHPFAYNTALGDTMANSEMIVEKQSGEKRIQYLIDHTLYTIRHVYTRKPDDSLSVKSFLMEGDVELNPSGTVNTFEELIGDIFELDKTYLGLLSLGNTVKGFVDYTGGDRKQLVTKIFTKLNVFGRYYKHASNRVRNIKSVLNNTTAKLDKYSNYDKEDAKREIEKIDQRKKELDAEKERTLLERGSIHQKMLHHQDFLSSYQEKCSRILELLDLIDATKRKIHTSKDIPALESDLKSLQKVIEDHKVKQSAHTINLESALDYMQSIKFDLEETNHSMERMSQNMDLEELDSLKASLDAKLASLVLPDVPIPFTREELVHDHIFLEQLQGMCIDLITEVKHEEIVADVAKKYLQDNTLLKKSEEKHSALLAQLQQTNYLRNTRLPLGDIVDFHLPETDCKTKADCPYHAFYRSYQEMVTQKEGEIDHTIHKQQEEVDIASDVVKVGKIVKRLQQFLKRNPELLELPTEIFHPETFLDLYMKKREVFQEDLMSSLIDAAEQQELQKELLKQLKEVEQKKENYESLRSSYDILKERAKTLEEKLSFSKNSVEFCQRELPLLKAEIEKVEQTQEKVKDAIELSKTLETYRSELAVLKKETVAMESTSKKVEQLQQQEQSLIHSIAELDMEWDELQQRRERLFRTISVVNDLEKEQLKLMEQYGEAESVRNAVSPTKGIPLEYIKKYIKGDLISMVNELLDLVYHGELYLDANRVVIDDTEFTIPYKRRGTFIKDISQASDGERAVMGLAFSLSLARITSKAYNILLLDEMDTTLDTYSRGRYIDMIVAYMKLIKCHQVFLISHNSMFDNYPVNILLTSEMNVSNIKQADIVRLWERRVPT